MHPLPDLLCTHKLGTSPKTHQSTAQRENLGRILLLKLSMDRFYLQADRLWSASGPQNCTSGKLDKCRNPSIQVLVPQTHPKPQAKSVPHRPPPKRQISSDGKPPLHSPLPGKGSCDEAARPKTTDQDLSCCVNQSKLLRLLLLLLSASQTRTVQVCRVPQPCDS